MSGLFGGGEQKTTTEVKLPEHIERGSREIFNRAQDLVYNTPYQVYEGPRTAAPVGNQSLAWDLFARNATAAAPSYINPAIQRGTEFMDNPGQDIGAFMNPYEDQVVQKVIADMSRVRDIDAQKLASAKALGGAYGGARHGVQEAEQTRDYYDRLGANLSNLRRHGYLDAFGMASESQGRRLDAARTGTDYYRTTQDQNRADAESLATAGAQERAIEQQRLDRAAADWEKLYNMPFDRINFLTNTLAGIPYGQTEKSTTKLPGDIAGGIAKLLMSAAAF